MDYNKVDSIIIILILKKQNKYKKLDKKNTIFDHENNNSDN